MVVSDLVFFSEQLGRDGVDRCCCRRGGSVEVSSTPAETAVCPAPAPPSQVIQQALHRQPSTAAQYLQQMYAAQQQHLMLQTAALQQQHLSSAQLQSLAAVQQVRTRGVPLMHPRCTSCRNERGSSHALVLHALSPWTFTDVGVVVIGIL